MQYILRLGCVTLFFEEAITYVLEYNNLRWNPPVPIPTLMERCDRYFFPSMGQALVHHCMVDEALRHVRLIGFDMGRWIEMSPDAARNSLRQNLRRYVRQIIEDDFFKHLYVIAFICYLSCYVVKRDKSEFTYFIVSEAADFFYMDNYTSARYTYLFERSYQYNITHRVLHEQSEDEGFYSDTGSEDDEDDFRRFL
ncbi:hypothetical protein NPIL_606181 [Nephila pilipes]|uniref:Uncharacterized protein n=1 Tax=Nephila pilipes TaxID=299642 RepID=A0A8X6PVR1_NEPPI|nr:hypothetical protein NPIL_606181 [Nephila pilipes]